MSGLTNNEAIRANAHLFSYNKDTGGLIRNGAKVGGINRDGYVELRVCTKLVVAHRLIWFIANGVVPSGEIDHINGDRADNRLCNLRDVTPSENRMNQRIRSDNTSGTPGVTFRHSSRHWVAQICVAGRRRHLGSYQTREAAVAARLAAQSTLPFGPNHGAPQT